MDLLLADNIGYDVWEVEDIPSTAESIVILGKTYKYEDLDEIRDDVQSRLWCTYRKGFPPLGSFQYTSDKGFGCMMRCGQMLLAEALIQSHIGRDWRWTSDTKDPTYLQIVNKFEDTKSAVYGIHHIAIMGQESGKKISEWYSPNVIAQVIRKLVRFDEFSNLHVHVALDHQLALDDIIEVTSPLLIIIPLRLGLTDINPIYIPALKRCFEIPGTLGIIGGRPNQALYFIGYVGNEALYLDPHTCQRSGSINNKESQNEVEMDETFHQKHAGRINFSSMDPSIAVAFLCKTQKEFNDLILNLKNPNDTTETPLFEIVEERAQPWVSTSMSSRDLEHDLSVICGDQNQEFEKLDKETEGGDEDEDDDGFEIID